MSYKNLKILFEEQSLINDISGILNWDMATYMPENSRRQRIKQITKDSESFIYSVNLKGITGVKTVQVDEANKQIEKIKKFTNLPVVAGFGIKTPQDVEDIAKSNCDGVVVGSQIVRYIQENIDDKNLPQKLGTYVKSFVEVLK